MAKTKATFKNKTDIELTFGVFGRRTESHFHVRVAPQQSIGTGEFTVGWAYCFAAWVGKDDGQLYQSNAQPALTGYQVSSRPFTVTAENGSLTVTGDE